MTASRRNGSRQIIAVEIDGRLVMAAPGRLAGRFDFALKGQGRAIDVRHKLVDS